MRPERPLGVKITELEVDDFIFLGEFAQERGVALAQLRSLKAFVAKCTDWTEEEIGRLTITELRDALGEMLEALEGVRENAVPLPIESSSSSGPAVTPTSSQAGQRSAKSRRRGASLPASSPT